MERIVECVPNFSEGRRKEVVDQIGAAIRSVPGVHLLDVEMDPDHNRAVLTFVGSPESVGEAAFRAVRQAARLIDMTDHEGEHPRIGATDVVPFVPVRGVTMEECVELAQQVGRRIGAELEIPVYLYEEAATRPERRNLANIRRGEYEGLAGTIATDPERAPDFGPAELGSAGATVVGARPFLIAYNVYLGTGDLDVAKRIARAVRHSSGGLRFVKALGIAVDRPNQVQVSMNLTNFLRTPIHRVMALIRAEADRYGVPVLESEVVGLIPEQALTDVARHELQWRGYRPDLILERRLEAAMAEQDDLRAALPRAFLARVAAGTPTPGGGSVAAMVGATAAALARMVANLTVGKKRYAEVQEQVAEIEAAVAQLQEELLDLVVQDAAAFDAILAAYRLARETEEEQAERSRAIQAATREASRVPLATAERAVKVLEFLAQVAAVGNVNARTDAAVGAHMARAAVAGAARNVRINLQDLEDADLVAQFRSQIAHFEQQADDLLEAVLALAG